jgi:hypothetical protein
VVQDWFQNEKPFEDFTARTFAEDPAAAFIFCFIRINQAAASIEVVRANFYLSYKN